jgi:hypothetical protein
MQAMRNAWRKCNARSGGKDLSAPQRADPGAPVVVGLSDEDANACSRLHRATHPETGEIARR